jgi:glycosyltransferase involved in cell wall biosynthesis
MDYFGNGFACPARDKDINTALRRFQPRVYGENRKTFSTHSNLIAAVALYMVWYDSGGVHQMLRATLAMEAKVTDPIWSVRELLTAWRSDQQEARFTVGPGELWVWVRAQISRGDGRPTQTVALLAALREPTASDSEERSVTDQSIGLPILKPGERTVSVVIPAFNSEKTLAACLRAVFSSDYPSFEVILVNDGSADQTASIAAKFPCKQIDLAKNIGAAAARNRGVRAAKGDLLFFLDADIVIEKDTLTKVARTFVDRPEISALFCSYQKNTPSGNFCSTYKNLFHHFTHQTAREDAATFCAGFGAIYRESFLRVGGFDESYRNMEDVELGYRLHQRGYKIFLNKDIQVTHRKVYSPAELVRSDFLHRAIPWTRIMLEKRIYRNDLNTRYANMASAFTTFCLLVTLPLIPFRPSLAIILPLLFLLLFFLNWKFYRFVYGEKGLWFLLRAVVVNWFGYLYSGLGAVFGMASYLLQRVPTRGTKPRASD